MFIQTPKNLGYINLSQVGYIMRKNNKSGGTIFEFFTASGQSLGLAVCDTAEETKAVTEKIESVT